MDETDEKERESGVRDVGNPDWHFLRELRTYSTCVHRIGSLYPSIAPLCGIGFSFVLHHIISYRITSSGEVIGAGGNS